MKEGGTVNATEEIQFRAFEGSRQWLAVCMYLHSGLGSLDISRLLVKSVPKSVVCSFSFLFFLLRQSHHVSGAQWEKAVELFDQMQAKGCKPDSVTYGGLILAYEKGDQWRRALAAFDQMKNNNCRPDSVVYNTVVGVLWNTGVVWAQAKAVQVPLLLLH